MYYKCIKNGVGRITKATLFVKGKIYKTKLRSDGRLVISSEIPTGFPPFDLWSKHFELPYTSLGLHHFWALKDKFL